MLVREKGFGATAIANFKQCLIDSKVYGRSIVVVVGIEDDKRKRKRKEGWVVVA